MNKIEFYVKNKQIMKDETVKSKYQNYLNKAKNTLAVLDALDKLENSSKAKKLLNIPESFDCIEWVVITGYYAMYTSALALLAKIGFRSKNHTATLLVLDEFFVKKKLMDSKLLLTLKNALFQKEEIEKLSEARHQREIAQYTITKQTTKNIAEKIKKDSYDFVNKVELILMQK